MIARRADALVVSSLRGCVVGTLALFACGLSACAGPSSSKSPENVRSVAAPGLTPVEAPDAALAADAGTQADAQVLDPPNFGLARGTHTPADSALAQGDEAYFAERWDDALQAYGRAAALEPKDPAPIVGQVRARLAKEDAPTAHASAPNHPALKAAVASLRRALQLDANFGPAHLELGRALLVMDKADQAIASLRIAVASSDRDPEPYSALGVALLATGQGREAVEALRRSAALDPNNSARQSNLGTALLLRGHVHEAIRVFERAIVLAPDNGRLRTDLGTAYLAAHETQKALPHLRKAVELEPDRATFRSNLGYALQRSQDRAGAIVEYRKAIELDPKLGSAWINLGTALAQSGKRDEARKAFEQAVKLDPTDPRPRTNLQELDDIERAEKK